tara:strand:+ start:1252 stop:1599 length:348 start_codon:yes stop_codon:yes gene_type:complete
MYKNPFSSGKTFGDVSQVARAAGDIWTNSEENIAKIFTDWPQLFEGYNNLETAAEIQRIKNKSALDQAQTRSDIINAYIEKQEAEQADRNRDNIFGQIVKSVVPFGIKLATGGLG